MVKHVDDARAESKKAQEEREKAVKEAEEAKSAIKEGEVNVGMLKSQLDILRSNLGDVRSTRDLFAKFLYDVCVLTMCVVLLYRILSRTTPLQNLSASPAWRAKTQTPFCVFLTVRCVLPTCVL